VIGKGSLVLESLADELTAENGIRFTVRDRLEADADNLWPVAECSVTQDPLRIKCASADKRLKAALKAVPAAQRAFRWFLKMRRVPLTAPFKSPITVTLTYGKGMDRVGVIGDCAALGSSIVCKEF
jgi:hypothetical protein